MASFRERAEAELRGTTVENVQAQKSTKSNTSFRERAAAELTRSSKAANTAYRTQQRRQKLQEETQKQRQDEQKQELMQKLGRQTNLQRVDTGENENEIGTKNYLSYRGTDPREIPVKELTQYQIDKAKREATEKQAAKTKSRNLGDTILDTANQGAGQGFVVPIAQTADFLANLAPNAVAKIKGEENPEHTFTGQIMKPLTDTTQKFLDWATQDTNASAQRVQEDTKDSKAAQIAAEIGAGVVGAIPNAALAMMTAGGSAATTLAPQTTGLSGTAANAVQKVVQNPSFQMSYLQSLGGAYQDAKEAGASEVNATAAAFISAAANALVEVGGGLETLPGDLQAKDLSTFEQAKEWLTSALDEGKEEVVQGVISALTNKVAANSDTPYFSMNDQDAVINPARMGQEFGMGAAVGGILGGAELLGTKALNRIGQRNVNANVDSTNVDIDHAASNANTDTQMDPLDYAFQETMKPTKEQQAFDQALEDTANVLTGSAAASNAKGLKPLQNANQEQISTFVNNSFENTNNYQFLRISEVSDDLARAVGAEGVNIDGYIHALRDNDIRHIRKRHGDLSNSKYPVTATDIENVRQIIDAPDNVYIGYQTKGGNDTIVYEKTIGTKTFYVEEVLADGVLSTKQMLKTGADSNPSFLKKYKKVTGGLSDTDVSLEAKSTGQSPPGNHVQDADYTTSYDSNIPNSNQNVNQNQNVNSDNDMGAKKSDFDHEVKSSKTAANTIGVNERLEGVPKEARGDNKYTAITEKESLANAKARLEQNLPDELDALKRSTTWTNEEFDMAMAIRDIFRRDADATGDWSRYMDWRRTIKEHGTSAAQALQSMAKWTRNSGSGIVSEAADILASGDTRRKVDTDAVMDTVSDYANLFDRAVSEKSVDGLVQLIKDTAGERNTAYRKRKDGTQRQSKYLNRALNRIAGYAKSGELTGNVDSDLEITAANIQKPDVAFKFLQDFASTGILNIAADTQKVSAKDHITSIRIQNLLSKAATKARNLGSNGLFGDIVDTFTRDISVPLDMAFSLITKQRSISFDKSWVSKAKRQGTLDCVAMASLESSLDVQSREGGGGYRANGTRTHKMSGGVIERFFSRLEGLENYGLYVTDEAAKGGTSAEIQRGTDKLYDKGKIKATDDSLRDAGIREAEYRTYQDKNKLSNAAVALRDDVLNKAVPGLGDFYIPFARVPANLAMRTIEHSPAGSVLMAGYQIGDSIVKAYKGKFTAADQAKLVKSVGRVINGAMLTGLSTWAAKLGIIVAADFDDEDENKDRSALEKMMGVKGFRWNISCMERCLKGDLSGAKKGDNLVSLAWMEPLNEYIGIGCLLAEDIDENGKLTIGDVTEASAVAALNSILELPMLDFPRTFSDNYTYSKAESTIGKIGDAALQTLGQDALTWWIPNAVTGIAAGLDPYERDLYSKDDFLGRVGDQIKGTFARDTLPIKLDSFGHEVENEGGVLNFLNKNILPGEITTYKGNELTDEMIRLAEETGSNAVFPSRKAPNELSIDGEEIPLSYEERQQYQQVYGNTDEAIRTRLMESDIYNQLSSEEQFKAHQYSEDYAKQIAASTVNPDYDTDDWVEELRGKSEAEIVEAVLYQTFKSLANSKEYSSKYEGMADLVDQDKLDEAMAVTMMPEKMQTAYQNVAKAGGVSVDEWLDLYAYAYPYGKTESGTVNNEQIRDHALEYIKKQSWGDDKKTAAADAIFQFLTDTIPLERDIPYNWSLDLGDSGLAYVESKMSKTQKENYEKYVKGHFDNEQMKLYLDAYAFKGTAKNIYEEDGETVKYSAKNQVIDYIDSLDLTNTEKIRFFLGLDYSDKSVPNWWY